MTDLHDLQRPGPGRLAVAAQHARLAVAAIETVALLVQHGEAYSAEAGSWLQAAAIALSDAATFLSPADGRGPAEYAPEHATTAPTVAHIGPHPMAAQLDALMPQGAATAPVGATVQDLGTAPEVHPAPTRISDVIALPDIADPDPEDTYDPDDLGDINSIGPGFPPVIGIEGTQAGDGYSVQVDPDTGVILECPCKAFAARHQCRHAQLATARLIAEYGLILPGFEICKSCTCPIDAVAARCACRDCEGRHGTLTVINGRATRAKPKAPARGRR